MCIRDSHGGFIPWDDDMDVVMLRADYERLIAGFDEWKSSDRFSLAWYRDGKSIYSFVKLLSLIHIWPQQRRFHGAA